ncbi:MAG: DUF1588 domain-containing protein [Bdellovibrionota bacterium]
MFQIIHGLKTLTWALAILVTLQGCKGLENAQDAVEAAPNFIPGNTRPRVIASSSPFRAILANKCLSCHGSGSRDGDFTVSDEDLIQRGYIAQSGDPDASSLYYRLRGANSNHTPNQENMPPTERDRLTNDELTIVRNHIISLRRTLPPSVAFIRPADGRLSNQTRFDVEIACTVGAGDVTVSGQAADVISGFTLPCEPNGRAIGQVTVRAGDYSSTLTATQTINGQTDTRTLNFSTDTVAPVVSLNGTDGDLRGTQNFSVSGGCLAADNGRTVTLSGNLLNGATVDATCQNSVFTANVTVTAGVGNKTINANMSDAAGNSSNTAARVFRYDNNAPVVTITAPTAAVAPTTGGVSAVALAGDCVTGLNVRVSVRVGGNVIGTPTNVACTNARYAANVTLPAPDGTKEILVQQTNAANLTGSASRNYQRDTAAPALAVTAPAPDASPNPNAQTSVNARSVNLSGTCETGLTVNVSQVGVAGTTTANCDAPGTFSVTGFQVSAGDGQKQIQLNQRDAATNTGAITKIIVLDTVAPTLTITDAPAANSEVLTNTFTVGGACQGNLPVTITVTSSVVVGQSNSVNTACTGGVSYSAYVGIEALAPGAFTLSVTQRDVAGNTGQAPSRSIIKAQSLAAERALQSFRDTVYAITNTRGDCAACHYAAGAGMRFPHADSNIYTAYDAAKSLVNFTNPELSRMVAVCSTDRHRNYRACANGGRELEDAIRSWWSGGEEAYALAGHKPFACAPGSDPGITPTRRLSKAQYGNTIRDLLRVFNPTNAADFNAIAAALAPEVDQLPSDEGGTFDRMDLRVNSAHVNVFYTVASLFADQVSSTNARLLRFAGQYAPSCTSVTPPTSQCVNDFIAGFGLYAYRRPLIAEEVTSYRAMYDAPSTTGLRNLIARFLMAPEFIYQVEVGNLASAETDVFSLTPYEVAARLSFHFWDTMPNTALFNYADDPSPNPLLASGAAFQNIVNEVLNAAHPDGGATRTRQTFDRFYSQWLQLSYIPNLSANNSPAYPNFIDGLNLTGLRNEMIQEVLDFANYYTWDTAGTFSQLLTSNRSFARSNALASIYGTSTWAGSGNLPPATTDGIRAGLFTRAGMLVTGNHATNPIKRGVYMRKQILCDNLPDPNPTELPDGATSPVTEPADTDRFTTRERYTHRTHPVDMGGFAPTSMCMTCHSQIDPLGFLAESFDGLGRVRSQERLYSATDGRYLASVNINPVAQPQIVSGDTRSANDASDLYALIDDSGKAHSCFVRRYFNFAFGKTENVGTDGCSLEGMREKLTRASGGGIRTMFLDFVNQPEFRMKKRGPQ